jgi:predicted thioredoxin/glutaredoxin
MNTYNKLEIIGFALLLIRAIFWISERMFVIESLTSIYEYAQIVFWLGLFIWALGYMQKEGAEKDEQPKEA